MSKTTRHRGIRGKYCIDLDGRTIGWASKRVLLSENKLRWWALHAQGRNAGPFDSLRAAVEWLERMEATHKRARMDEPAKG